MTGDAGQRRRYYGVHYEPLAVGDGNYALHTYVPTAKEE